MKPSNRFIPLDVFTGITVSGIILINNPGAWSAVFAPLKHVKWDGLSPSDLLFPFFVFIIGIAAYLSLDKLGFKASWQNVFNILKRTTTILLVAFGLTLISHWAWNHQEGESFFAGLRISGVLQRLGLVYGFVSLVGLVVNRKYILHIVGVVLVGYWALLSLTGSMVLSEANIIAVVDGAILGEAHMYTQTLADGKVIAFDPEGILSTITSVALAMLGLFAGKLVVDAKGNNELMVRNIFVLGTITLLLGWLFSYGCPINKKLWSSTLVLVICGSGSLLFALLIWAIEIKKWKLGVRFFEAFGVNALYLFIQSSLLSVLLISTGVYSFAYNSILNPIFGNYGGSLVYAILFVLLNSIPAYFLWKKQIQIKL